MAATVKFYGQSVIDALKTTMGATVEGVTIRAKFEADPMVYFASASTTMFPCVCLQPLGDFPDCDYADREVPKHVVQNYRATLHYVEERANLNDSSAYEQVRRRAELLAGVIAGTTKLGLSAPLHTHSDGVTDFIQYTAVTRVGASAELQRFFKENQQIGRVVWSFDVWAQILGRKPRTTD